MKITKKSKVDKNRKASNVLTEKYRPLTVKNIILPDRYRKLFGTYIEEQEIQNTIIHSVSPGVGKSTLGKALANDCNYDYIYINASLYRGIDTLRSDIADYATHKSVDGKRKVVLLDEFDEATVNLQKALKGAIEEYYDRCRFILTANNINKIIQPLQSRCAVVSFDFNEEDKKKLAPQIEKRLCGIAKREGIEYEEGVMGPLVDAMYPDIRKMITLISEYSKTYEIINEGIFSFTQIDDEVADLILDGKSVKKVRQYIMNNNYQYENLYRYVFDKVIPKVENNSIKGDLYTTTAEYLDMATRSWDQEITFTGFLIAFMDIIREG